MSVRTFWRIIVVVGLAAILLNGKPLLGMILVNAASLSYNRAVLGNEPSSPSRLARAEQLARAAAGQCPSCPRAHALLAAIARRRGDLARALTHTDQWLTREPAHAVALVSAGDIADSLGRTPEALAYWRRARAARLLLHRGAAAASRGDAARAAGLLDRARGVGLADCDEWLLAGDLAIGLGDTPGAAEAYARCLDLAPTRSAGYERLAALQIESDPGAADTTIQAAFTACPVPGPALHLLRSRLRAAAGRLDDAHRDALAALREQPTNAVFLLWAGDITRQRGDLAGAAAYYATAQRATTQPAMIADSALRLGQIHESAGRVQAALDAYDTAARALERPGAPAGNRNRAHVALALLLHREGRDAEARAAIERALVFDSDNRSLRALLDSFR